MPKKFVGLGNPLLDMIVYVDNDDLFTKYNLKQNDAILSDEKSEGIYSELVDNHKVTYVSGGAGLNTMKMIKWLSEDNNTVSYYGSIGNDETGKKLLNDCQQIGLQTDMIVDETLSTGKCAVIVKGVNRSMVTHLGAAISFNVANISEKMWLEIKTGEVFYICAYFVNSSMETTLKVASMASEDNGKVFAFNLSAPFLSMFFCDKINQVLPHVDILFGNADEISAYAKTNKLPGDVKETAKYLQKYERKNTTKPGRMVVITNGAESIVLVAPDGCLHEFPVEQINDKEIIDSNGAGDAFAGGFLVEYAKERNIKDSINTAMRAARYILKQSGFQLKNKSFESTIIQ